MSVKQFAALFAALALAVRTAAETETVDGVEYTYTVADGKATIYNSANATGVSFLRAIGTGEINSAGSPAIPQSTTGELKIPATLGGCPVASIGSHAFTGCKGLSSATIPDSVTNIGYCAFYGCSGLIRVDVPDSVETIGAGAFYKCTNMRVVGIPDSVTSIGKSAFYYCMSLMGLYIPDSVESIGDFAFYGCFGLAYDDFVIVRGVLYDYAGAASDVTIPSSVTSIGHGAFYNRKNLTSVTIPDSVKSIGPFAFYLCGGLARVDVPDSVETIGAGAFWKCGGLADSGGFVAVRGALYDYVGEDAVVAIPGSVTNIDDYAFFGRPDVTGVVIPDSVTRIGQEAFQGCSGLTNVVIPDSVESLGRASFMSCSGLTSVTIGKSVDGIGVQAFARCERLSCVTMRGDAPSVAAYAFSGVAAGCVVRIPQGASGYEVDADGTWQGMTVRYYDPVKEERDATKYLYSGGGDGDGEASAPLAAVAGDFGAMTQTTNDIGGSVTLALNGAAVSDDGASFTVGDEGFHIGIGKENVTSVTVVVECSGLAATDGVRSLFMTHTSGGVNMEGVAIKPDASLQGIWEGGNYGSASGEIPTDGERMYLVMIYARSHLERGAGVSVYCVKDGVCQLLYRNAPLRRASDQIHGVMVGGSFNGAIPSCVGLVVHSFAVYDEDLSGCALDLGSDGAATVADLRPPVFTIDENGVLTGANIYSATDIAIPDGVTAIGADVFKDCTGLKTATIPEGVGSIGIHAFRSCSSLESVALPSTLTNLENAVFEYCPSLKSIEIPAGVTHFGTWQFNGCSSLERVTLPEGLASIPYKTFTGCTSLTEIDIPDSVTIIDEFAFYDCTSLERVAIPDAVTLIAARAFWGCNALKDLTIGRSVVGMGYGAFAYCYALEEVVLPARLEWLGSYVFWRCGSLKSVTMRGDAPDVAAYVFNYTASPCTVHLSQDAIGYEVDANGNWHGLSVSYYTPAFAIDDEGALTEVDVYGAARVTIPDGVTRIGGEAFRGCGELTSVTIPDGVEAIAPTAFDGCEKLWAKWFKTLERMSAEDATSASLPHEVALTVTNVVVHYVTASRESAAVTVPTTTGIVNIISEVNAGAAVAIPSAWAEQYEGFEDMFGNDFAAAVTAPTGKRDGAGNAMQVWQDFVAGTDPTDESDVFTASITFDADGNPVISHSPELPAAEAAKRVYTTYGKVKLNDADWTPVPDGEESDYNFFKVTVEMR